jgi:hypothetical protein
MTQPSTIIMLKNVRLLYGAAVHQAQRGPNGEGDLKFSATFGFPKDHPAAAAIKAAFQAAATAKWGAKAADVFAQLKAGDRLCLHDGDAKADKEGYKGNLYVSASNKTKPTIVDGSRVVLDATSGKPYSGCYVNAQVEIWAQDNKFGKRLNATLRGIQFVRDGARLSGGGVSSVDEYEMIPDEGGSAFPEGNSEAKAPAKAPNPFD